MTIFKERISTQLGVILLLALGMVGFQAAQSWAVTPGLYVVTGNPSCANLYQAEVLSGPGALTDLGPLFGFKYDTNPTGNVSSTLTNNAPWTLTGGSPADQNNSVSISNVVLSGNDGVKFDWLATLGINAVIVKGGPGSNAYVYSPEAFGASGLMAPDGKAISHVEFCYDYDLTAEKTAAAEYTATYTWDITKDYDGAYDKFIGDPATSHGYEVSVDQTVTYSDFAVSGTIKVSNPTPYEVTFSVADFVNGTAATVNCPTNTLAAGASTTCSYSASLGGAVNGTNTATVTSENPNVGGATATADYAFDDPTTVVGYPEIKVSDDKYGLLGSASADETFTYNRDFECSTDPADYTDGSYTFIDTNTATIEETEQSDVATVTVTCYAPIVEKDANASYDERHDWDVSKTVTDPVGPFYPGDEPSWTWTIDIIETVKDQNFAVTGDIDVTNPAGSPGSITVDLADVLDDGTVATVDCGDDATSVTVAPGATETCSYSAAPGDAWATLNTATGTFNEIDFVATADVNFVKTMVNDEATVSDAEIGLLDELVSGGDQFTADDDGVCSSDWADYGDDGTYTVDLSNTAILVDAEDNEYTSTATTSYTCEAFTVDLLKTTNGIEDPDAVWSFELYEGPDGFDTTAIASDSTPPALLDFGGPALRPDTTYTVCEVGVPAGWTSFWQLNGSTVIPYNPDADSDPSEDLGNRCVDFGGTVETPVTAGTVFSFAVDNSFPGGDPRTPGYWKNWNRCTGGGQADNADKNGGWEEGYWLLEDVLNPNIGGGIVWDDILDDEFVFTIDSCAVAVDILDKRLVGDPAIVGDGKKSASDPLVNLATHLLAAQLNFGAGACTTQEVLDAALQAETLLDKYNFDGTTAGLIPKKDKVDGPLANSLANYLDDYNNGEFCGSTNGS